MSWHRLGLIYVPDGSLPTARSHASQPTPLHLQDDIYRFYFSARDSDKRSHIHWVDVAISEKPRVIARAQAPVLSPGEDGAFDDSGVSVGCIVRAEAEVRLYYMGWNLGVRSPWRNAIGVASAPSTDGPFRRWSPGPILDRSPEDPYTLTYPWVVQGADHEWRMWYGSNLSPALDDANLRHLIKHAQSPDGLRWDRNGRPVADFATPDEYVIVRPTVVRGAKGWLMAYACRGDHYRVVLSASDDGQQWARIPDAGLSPTGAGWESAMTCYPALFAHRGRLWMAYNGDGYGETGFGLATWYGGDCGGVRL